MSRPALHLGILAVCAAWACSGKPAAVSSAPDAGNPGGALDAGGGPTQDPSRDLYMAVWGSGADNVVIAGDDVRRRWDGHSWNREYPVTIDAGGALFGAFTLAVWGSGPNDVWASVDWVRGDFLHWDGASWSFVDMGGETVLWNGLWGSAPNDVWTVGGAPAEVRHWNGQAWIVDSGWRETGYPFFFFGGVWGSGRTIWAVGTAEGTSPDGSLGAVLRRSAQGAWSLERTSPQPINAVWGSGPSDVWAVGRAGTIVHFDGTTWSSPPSLTTSTLLAVWGSGPADVWAVGDSGTILHFDGVSWTAHPGVDPTVNLNGIWGSGPQDIWVVGNHGTILHLTGP